MYTSILVSGKLNYSALIFRKTYVFVVDYPWPQTKLPPNSSVLPLFNSPGDENRTEVFLVSKKDSVQHGQKELDLGKKNYFNIN